MKRYLSNSSWSVAVLLFALMFTSTANFRSVADAADNSEEPQPDTRSTLVNTMGIEGVYYIHHDSDDLQVRPKIDDDLMAVRVADVVREKDTYVYEIRYIAEMSGSFDLRKYLMHADGRPVSELAPAHVVVRELLTADHDGSLWKLPDPEMLKPIRYKLLLVLIATVWTIPAVWLLLRWMRRRPDETVMEKIVLPTFADQIRPLVEVAVNGSITRQQQARLELLLIGYWRDRLALGDKHVQDALVVMRQDRQAGRLLHELEAWLHRPPGLHRVDVAKLLEPYRSAWPIDESRLEKPVSAAQQVPL